MKLEIQVYLQNHLTKRIRDKQESSSESMKLNSIKSSNITDSMLQNSKKQVQDENDSESEIEDTQEFDTNIQIQQVSKSLIKTQTMTESKILSRDED